MCTLNYYTLVRTLVSVSEALIKIITNILLNLLLKQIRDKSRFKFSETYLFGEKSLDDFVPSAFSLFIRRHLVVFLNNKIITSSLTTDFDAHASRLIMKSLVTEHVTKGIISGY